MLCDIWTFLTLFFQISSLPVEYRSRCNRPNHSRELWLCAKMLKRTLYYIQFFARKSFNCFVWGIIPSQVFLEKNWDCGRKSFFSFYFYYFGSCLFIKNFKRLVFVVIITIHNILSYNCWSEESKVWYSPYLKSIALKLKIESSMGFRYW